MKTQYAFHPLADLFPLIEEGFLELSEDIKVNGLADPIVLHEGKILDGRNRYRAIHAAGLKPLDHHFIQFTGPDPVSFVISKNIHRRHLTAGQKAWAAAQFETLKHGGDRKKSKENNEDQDANLRVDRLALAERFGVSERSINDAAKVRDRGVDELIEALKGGHVAVDVAGEIATLPAQRQHAIIDDPSKDIARVARNEIKKEKRDNREKVLGAMQRALPQKKYGFILCDLARRFNVRSRDTGLDRSPDNHYPTMTFAQACALDVPSIAADDCIMAFWSTPASLIDDLEILAEWGFVTLRPREAGLLRRDVLQDGEWQIGNLPAGPQPYRSMQVWNKGSMGLGYWFRGNEYEFVLVCARGNVVAPAPGTQPPASFGSPRGDHSEKPVDVYEWIERLWPSAPRVELFARAEDAREGWDVWGLEAPQDREAIVDQYLAIEGACCDRDEMVETRSEAHSDDEVIPPSVPQATVSPESESTEDDNLEIPLFLRRQQTVEAEKVG